jgi:hypothetical protein
MVRNILQEGAPKENHRFPTIARTHVHDKIAALTSQMAASCLQQWAGRKIFNSKSSSGVLLYTHNMHSNYQVERPSITWLMTKKS